jgi:hypothetical protein
MSASNQTSERVRLHDDCRICDVVNNPLPHCPVPRTFSWAALPAAPSRKVPAHVARYCRQTGQDVPDAYEAS